MSEELKIAIDKMKSIDSVTNEFNRTVMDMLRKDGLYMQEIEKRLDAIDRKIGSTHVQAANAHNRAEALEKRFDSHLLNLHGCEEAKPEPASPPPHPEPGMVYADPAALKLLEEWARRGGVEAKPTIAQCPICDNCGTAMTLFTDGTPKHLPEYWRCMKCGNAMKVWP